jgi:hypothetical protein
MFVCVNKLQCQDWERAVAAKFTSLQRDGQQVRGEIASAQNLSTFNELGESFTAADDELEKLRLALSATAATESAMALARKCRSTLLDKFVSRAVLVEHRSARHPARSGDVVHCIMWHCTQFLEVCTETITFCRALRGPSHIPRTDPTRTSRDRTGMASLQIFSPLGGSIRPAMPFRVCSGRSTGIRPSGGTRGGPPSAWWALPKISVSAYAAQISPHNFGPGIPRIIAAIPHQNQHGGNVFHSQLAPTISDTGRGRSGAAAWGVPPPPSPVLSPRGAL